MSRETSKRSARGGPNYILDDSRHGFAGLFDFRPIAGQPFQAGPASVTGAAIGCLISMNLQVSS
jgi:hypothetical protein